MALTYNDLYLEIRRALKGAGVEACALEARVLLAQASGCSEAELMAKLRMYTGNDVVEKARAMAARRLSGEPAAYITGQWEFYGLPMYVNRSVLIPRQDTEELVKMAVGFVLGLKTNARVMDLCCGSGCVGCAIAHKLPAARIVMVDISAEALAVCRKNISVNRLSSRAICIQADVLCAPPVRMGEFDLVVCNPPYIPTGELDELDSSVRDWEPSLALDGGGDGLLFYHSVLANWCSVLKEGGRLMFEVGEGQAQEVKGLLQEAGYHDIGGAFDTLGTERVVYGTK